MRTYMDYNLKMRTATKNDILKLTSNSPFKTTMENVLNFVEVKYKRDPENVRKIVKSVWYRDFDRISEDIVIQKCSCKTMYLNRPIYSGMKIVVISKFNMFDFLYNVLKPEFCKDLRLIRSDTDSL